MASNVLVTSLSSVFGEMNNLVQNTNIMYGLILVFTFFALFVLVKGALKVAFAKHSGMNEKAITVLSVFVSLIGTSGLFWRNDATTTLTFISNLFSLGILLIIIVALNWGIIWFCWFKQGREMAKFWALKLLATCLTGFLTINFYLTAMANRAIVSLVDGKVVNVTGGGWGTVAEFLSPLLALYGLGLFVSILALMGALFLATKSVELKDRSSGISSTGEFKDKLEKLKTQMVDFNKKMGVIRKFLEDYNSSSTVKPTLPPAGGSK